MLAWLKCRLTKGMKKRARIGDGASQIIIFNFNFSILMICLSKKKKYQYTQATETNVCFSVWTLNNNSDAMRCKKGLKERQKGQRRWRHRYDASVIILSFHIYSNAVRWMQSNEIWLVYFWPFLVDKRLNGGPIAECSGVWLTTLIQLISIQTNAQKVRRQPHAKLWTQSTPDMLQMCQRAYSCVWPFRRCSFQAQVLICRVKW